MTENSTIAAPKTLRPGRDLPVAVVVGVTLLVGVVDTFGKVLIPQTAGILVYVLMAAILLWRPEGLFRTS